MKSLRKASVLVPIFEKYTPRATDAVTDTGSEYAHDAKYSFQNKSLKNLKLDNSY